MRKSTIFISAVLTTFALVMLYRVASAYNDNKIATNVSAEPTSVPAETEPPEEPAPTEVVLGPEQAAQLAAQVVGNTNLLSAETSNFNGTAAYLVTFTNNDLVYVGLDGQILSVQIATPAPKVVNIPPPTKARKHKGNGGGAQANSSSGGNHEGGEDHEDDDHGDD